MIVTSILGILTGGLTSIIPGVLSYLVRRDELRHEQQILAIRAKYREVDTKLQIDLIDVKADADEGKSLRDHDANLDGTGFISALRRSVRPVITYLFFFLFVFVKVVAVIAAMKTTGTEDWLGNAMLWNDMLPLVWDDKTSAIFGAIMGFWFGGRAIEKLLQR